MNKKYYYAIVTTDKEQGFLARDEASGGYPWISPNIWLQTNKDYFNNKSIINCLRIAGKILLIDIYQLNVDSNKITLVQQITIGDTTVKTFTFDK